MAKVVSHWLDDLSEDWIEPCQVPSNTTTCGGKSDSDSRRPNGDSSILRSSPQSMDHLAVTAGPRSDKAASKRPIGGRPISRLPRLRQPHAETGSSLNPKRDQAKQDGNCLSSPRISTHHTDLSGLTESRTPLRARGQNENTSVDHHATPIFSTDTVVHGTTVNHVAAPTDGSKSTPEWKKRLLHGNREYTDRRDLFSPHGLENIFQRPQDKLEAPSKPGLSFLKGIVNEPHQTARLIDYSSNTALPSSPPPWHHTRIQSSDSSPSDVLPVRSQSRYRPPRGSAEIKPVHTPTTEIKGGVRSSPGSPPTPSVISVSDPDLNGAISKSKPDPSVSHLSLDLSDLSFSEVPIVGSRIVRDPSPTVRSAPPEKRPPTSGATPHDSNDRLTAPNSAQNALPDSGKPSFVQQSSTPNNARGHIIPTNRNGLPLSQQSLINTSTSSHIGRFDRNTDVENSLSDITKIPDSMLAGTPDSVFPSRTSQPQVPELTTGFANGLSDGTNYHKVRRTSQRSLDPCPSSPDHSPTPRPAGHRPGQAESSLLDLEHSLRSPHHSSSSQSAVFGHGELDNHAFGIGTAPVSLPEVNSTSLMPRDECAHERGQEADPSARFVDSSPTVARSSARRRMAVRPPRTSVSTAGRGARTKSIQSHNQHLDSEATVQKGPFDFSSPCLPSRSPSPSLHPPGSKNPTRYRINHNPGPILHWKSDSNCSPNVPDSLSSSINNSKRPGSARLPAIRQGSHDEISNKRCQGRLASGYSSDPQTGLTTPRNAQGGVRCDSSNKRSHAFDHGMVNQTPIRPDSSLVRVPWAYSNIRDDVLRPSPAKASLPKRRRTHFETDDPQSESGSAIAHYVALNGTGRYSRQSSICSLSNCYNATGTPSYIKQLSGRKRKDARHVHSYAARAAAEVLRNRTITNPGSLIAPSFRKSETNPSACQIFSQSPAPNAPDPDHCDSTVPSVPDQSPVPRFAKGVVIRSEGSGTSDDSSSIVSKASEHASPPPGTAVGPSLRTNAESTLPVNQRNVSIGPVIARSSIVEHRRVPIRKRSLDTNDFLAEAVKVMNFIRRRNSGTVKDGMDEIEEENEESVMERIGATGISQLEHALLSNSLFSLTNSLEDTHSSLLQVSVSDHFFVTDPSASQRRGLLTESPAHQADMAKDTSVAITTSHDASLQESRPSGSGTTQKTLSSRSVYPARSRSEASLGRVTTAKNGALDAVDTATSQEPEILDQGSQSSQDTGSRFNTVTTNGSRRSDTYNVNTLAPEAVAHLIPSEIGGMVFDPKKKAWVFDGNSRTRHKKAGNETNHSMSSPRAPFGQGISTTNEDGLSLDLIPDLSVDESREREFLHTIQPIGHPLSEYVDDPAHKPEPNNDSGSPSLSEFSLSQGDLEVSPSAPGFHVQPEAPSIPPQDTFSSDAIGPIRDLVPHEGLDQEEDHFQDISNFILSEMPDFTLHQEDELLQPLRRAVARGGQIKLESRFLRSTGALIRALQASSTGDYDGWTTLESVSLRDCGLESLYLLKEFCPVLTQLDVSGNNLRHVLDIGPRLCALDISHNLINSLTHWGSLVNLQFLDLSFNKLDSFTGLSGLIHLRELIADDNNAESLRGLDLLKGLEKLSLRRNRINSVDFDTMRFDRLTELDLSHNGLSKIHSLHRLRRLTVLSVEGNDIDDFSWGEIDNSTGSCSRDTSTVLNSSQSLVIVKLSRNKISRLDIIACVCPNAQRLYLDHNRISQPVDLSIFPALERVALRGQKPPRDTIRNALPPNLMKGQDKHPAEDSISFYGSNIHQMFFSRNPLGQLTLPLIPLYHLSELELSFCGLQALPPRFSIQVPNLRTLNVNFNALSDLSPLVGLSVLETLLAAGNRIRRLRQCAAIVSRLSTLKRLDFRDNPITAGLYPPITTAILHSKHPGPHSTKPTVPLGGLCEAPQARDISLSSDCSSYESVSGSCGRPGPPLHMGESTLQSVREQRLSARSFPRDPLIPSALVRWTPDPRQADDISFESTKTNVQLPQVDGVGFPLSNTTAFSVHSPPFSSQGGGVSNTQSPTSATSPAKPEETFVGVLDSETMLRRLVYRILLASASSSLSHLDGRKFVPADVWKEAKFASHIANSRHAVGPHDTDSSNGIWEKLVALGVVKRRT